MKLLQLNIFLFLLLFTAIPAHSQIDWNAAGVWTGKLFNDTTKQFIPFEIAISYHNGKYSGYTYTVFLIDSVENIGVKEVSIKERNQQWIIKDKKLVDDNYKDAPAKGVYTTLELHHSEDDCSDILSGRWFTNKTKEFYPLTGTVTVSKRKNIFATRIVPRLQALGLADELSFFRYSSNVENTARNEIKKQPGDTESKDSMMTIVEPELVISLPKSKTKDLKLPEADVFKNVMDTLGSGEKAAQQKENHNEKKSIKKNNDVQDEVITLKRQPERNTPKSESVKDASDKLRVIQNKPDADLTATKNTPALNKDLKPSPTQSVPSNLTKSISSGKKPDQLQDTNLQKKNAALITQPLKPVLQPSAQNQIDLSKRKIETIRTVPVSGDSLVLSLFDNGAVDGDTVSVLLNGKVVISKVGLLEKAFNQTIQLTPDMGDSIRIVLYAENLGSIAPNTGLLVVRNAGLDYEIRFSGDLTKNSAIILLRNKKE